MKEYPFQKYGTCQVRLIVDTDYACEGDDAFAVAHALLTPKFDVRAVLAANYMNLPDSVQKSYNGARKLLDVMGFAGKVNLLAGSMPMKSRDDYERSEASDFIVCEALRDDERPLFIVCQGAITNLAVALSTNPEIASKIHCIWIGGAAYPAGGMEFNALNDICAANIVFDSEVSLWQVPNNVYSKMNIGFMSLYTHMKKAGAVGKYLWDQLMEFQKDMSDKYHGNPKGDGLAGAGIPMNLNKDDPWTYCRFATGDCWSLGDSPAIGLMLNADIGDHVLIGAPSFNSDGTYVLRPDNPRKITVYESINSGFILDDLFCKLSFQYGENSAGEI